MRVLLDDIPCDVTATTVSQAIEAAAVVANNKGRLIVEVSVDGSQWTERANALDGGRSARRCCSNA